MNQQIYVESDVSRETQRLDETTYTELLEKAVARMFVAEYGMVVQQGYLLPALLEKYPDG